MVKLALLSAAAQSPPPNVAAIHHFAGNDGSGPAAKLLEAPDGFLYGTTYTGGSGQGGTVFKVDKSGNLTTLHSFGDGEAAIDGESPVAPLILGSDGNFYGTTSLYGDPGDGVVLHGDGTIFRLAPDGTLTTLHTFTGPDGAQPFGPLLQAADGYFYGTTLNSAASTVFRMAADGALTTIHAFKSDASEGGEPWGLIQGPDGNFYGTTSIGGFGGVPGAGGGTVFQLTPAGTLTTLHYFQYGGAGPDGGNPVGGLTIGPDGAYYGLNGGGEGAAYKITSDGTLTTLHTFGCSCSVPEGAYPTGVLLLASDGDFYGVTGGGGIFNKGVLFSMTPAGVVTTLHSFADNNDGDSPRGGVIEGSDGRLYGVTGGGQSGHSTVYRVTFIPAAPSGVTAVAGDGKVTLSWQAVRSANTYSIFQGSTPGGEKATAVVSGIMGTTATVSGLPDGVTVYFTVAASNEAGTGSQSTEVSATPVGSSGATSQGGGGGGTLDLVWIALLSSALVSRTFARARLQ
jgi:uncharacterized repeat protein (TIGR03803 family)